MRKRPALFSAAGATLLLALPLGGCGPALVGGATVGVSVLHDRRDAGTVLSDGKIELTALTRIADDPGLSKTASIGVTSYNFAVLLTGQADSPAIKARVAQLVGAIPDVKRVVVVIAVAPRATLKSESHDLYLTSRVKLALFDLQMPDFDPSRVKVVTEQAVVYLMGLLTQAEAAAVVEKVRYVSGVKRVVKIFEYIEPKAGA